MSDVNQLKEKPLTEIESGGILMGENGLKRAGCEIIANHPWWYKKDEFEARRDTKRKMLVDGGVQLEEANSIVKEDFEKWLNDNKPLLWRFVDWLFPQPEY